MSENNSGAKTPMDHNQSKLMEFIMSEKAASVQTIIDGDVEGQTVRESEHVIEYDVFTLNGIEAKVPMTIYDDMPERLAKMQAEEIEKDKKKYTKDEIKMFIRAWCWNKCRALLTKLATREDFIELARFIEAIVFQEDKELREMPPKKIKKTRAISKYKVWETKKFKVKVGVDAFVRLEGRIKKLRKKGMKKDIHNLEAETEKVVFLQNHMSLKSGEWCSGPEFAAYYKELYEVMFPPGFGKPDKEEDEKKKKEEKEKDLHPDQEKLSDDVLSKEQLNEILSLLDNFTDDERKTIVNALKKDAKVERPHDLSSSQADDVIKILKEKVEKLDRPKKKRGRPKGSKNAGKSK